MAASTRADALTLFFLPNGGFLASLSPLPEPPFLAQGGPSSSSSSSSGRSFLELFPPLPNGGFPLDFPNGGFLASESLEPCLVDPPSSSSFSLKASST